MRGAQVSNFLSRWSLRKRKVQQGEEVSDEKVIDLTESVDHSEDIALINTHTELSSDTSSTETVEALEEGIERLTEEDLVSINGTSNVSQFMATGVDKNLKKAALRKMFLNPEFAMEDEPNYSTPPKLDPEIAAKLRDWMVEPIEEEEDAEASELLVEQAVENVEEIIPTNGNDNEYQCVNKDEAQESETKKTI